jgi:acyl carrier protein
MTVNALICFLICLCTCICICYYFATAITRRELENIKTVIVDLSFKPHAIVTFIAPADAATGAVTGTATGDIFTNTEVEAFCYSNKNNSTEIMIQSQVKEICASQLHMYLHPTFVHIIPNELFLQTSNFYDLAHTMSKKPISEPQSATESRVSELWKSHLKINRLIGVDDNFFELGGDSLKAGHLVSVLRKCFGVYNLSVGDLLHAPTVEGISRRIDELLLGQSPSPSPTRAIGSHNKWPGGSGGMSVY